MRTTLAKLASYLGTLAASGLAFWTTASADAASDSSGNLQEVIVTAQKTTEVASKTPLSLSVFSQEQLTNAGVTNLDSLATIAPNVEITNGGHGDLITIRGVTTTDNTSKGAQAVLFNIDGMAIGRPQVTQLSFFDLERIEVLRGPQGTLYGQSSTGGAINVITAKPTNTFQALGSVEFGNFNTHRETGMVNIPITDNFAIRLAGNANSRDGYLTPSLYYTTAANPYPQTINSQRPLDDEDNINGRFSARYLFGDMGDAILRFTAGHIGGTGNVSNFGLFDRVNDTGSYSRQVYYNPMAGVVDDQYHKIDGELALNFGAVHLAYVGGYLKFSGNDNYQPNNGQPSEANGPIPTYNWNEYQADNTYNSHEIRLSNAQPQRFEYVVGANWARERTNEVDTNWYTYVDPVPTSNPPCTVPAPNTAPGCSTPQPNILGENQHEQKGLFGQGNFHLTDTFKLTAGLRYSDDSMYRKASIAVGPPPTPPGYWMDANGNPCHPGAPCVPLNPDGSIQQNDNGSESASKVTWRVGADWQFRPDQMLYGYVATGYKPGAFNDACPSKTPGVPPQPCSYGPEDMTAYEIGYKGKITPNLQIISAIYYYDYAKFQLTQPTFLAESANGGPPAVIIYTTLVPVTMYGWEGELHWNPTANDFVNVTMNVANGYYNGGDGHATVGLDAMIPVDWSGKRLDNLPPFQSMVSYEHRFQMTDGGYFSAFISNNFSGGYYQSFLQGLTAGGPPFLGPPITNTYYAVPPTQFYQKPFTRTDARLSYTNATGKVIVDAFVRNIEDKHQMVGVPLNLYIPGTPNTGPDAVTVPVSAPRTFGVRVTVKY
jgi:iron complex outermembrane receptor protein